MQVSAFLGVEQMDFFVIFTAKFIEGSGSRVYFLLKTGRFEP